MQEQLVLRIVVKILLPFILMFGFYVQVHGEYSPGGGFQAGVIIASAFILYALIFGPDKTLEVVPLPALKALLSCGILIYAGTGVAALLGGGRYLEYGVLPGGQKFGILLIELGVGLTVAAALTLIFLTFARWRGPSA